MAPRYSGGAPDSDAKRAAGREPWVHGARARCRKGRRISPSRNRVARSAFCRVSTGTAMDDVEQNVAANDEPFEAFFSRVEPRLRSAFTALYGADTGRDAAAEALTWAFEHWHRVRRMDHPVGYLYRVGQSRTRRLRRPLRVSWARDSVPEMPELDPRLPSALAALPARQRVAVLLVHGYGWSHTEVADVMHVSTSTVATHVARALAALRLTLEEQTDERD
jgi:RNA polymerase sigma factor (sigma-70 family)